MTIELAKSGMFGQIEPATLLCCGFDSCRHTQILYKENRKMLFGAPKKQRKKKMFGQT